MKRSVFESSASKRLANVGGITPNPFGRLSRSSFSEPVTTGSQQRVARLPQFGFGAGSNRDGETLTAVSLSPDGVNTPMVARFKRTLATASSCVETTVIPNAGGASSARGDGAMTSHGALRPARVFALT